MYNINMNITDDKPVTMSISKEVMTVIRTAVKL